jgi:ABC-type sugar transport system ATPase subunit
VRPEHIRLAAQGVAGTVSSCEYHGADTILTVRVGEETFFVREPGQHAETVGTAVRLAWKPESQHVFDNNGRRSCV